jgi:hypothetical protein
MGGGNTGLGGDFVVLIKQEQPNQPRAWVETLAETSRAAPASLGVMVSLYPDIKSLDCDNDPKFNFVFVIDRCVCVCVLCECCGGITRVWRDMRRGQVRLHERLEGGGREAHAAAVPAQSAARVRCRGDACVLRVCHAVLVV